MKCPRCIKHSKNINLNDVRNSSDFVLKKGFFIRSSDGRKIQRYRCLKCDNQFSEATYDLCYHQKKRQINESVFNLFSSAVSQNRMALLLKVNRKTVVRKFLFLGQLANQGLLNNLHLKSNLYQKMEFDDVETFEHTKYKPLSITLAVESKTRFILGMTVSSMACKGPLAKESLEIYGKRTDERSANRAKLFKQLKNNIHTKAIIKSDLNPHYDKDVKKYFPDSKYLQYKGRKGCVVGQGEIKAVKNDPLFSLNHTAAMLRANLNRLFRRTWNTTKKADRLMYHLAIYSWYHNFKLILKKKKKLKNTHSKNKENSDQMGLKITPYEKLMQVYEINMHLANLKQIS